MLFVAADALAAGLDSPSLRILAGLDRLASPSEIDDVFQAVVRELHVEPRDPFAVKRKLARAIAGSVVQGEVEPYAGAGRIWRLFEWEPEREAAIASEFLQLEDMYEWDNPQPRAELDAMVIDAARQLLAASDDK